MSTTNRWHRRAAAAAAVCMIVAGCGDDDDADAAPLSFPAFGGSIAAGDTEVCALGQVMFDQDDFPSVEQLTSYRALAPEPIKDQVETAAKVLIAADGDLVKTMVAVADDEAEGAIDDINAWEEAYCGIPHSESQNAGPGATTEKDGDANQVNVSATDFSFEIGTVKAGTTTFRLVNDGKQAHYLGLAKLSDGIELSEALASEDGSGIEGEWSTKLAAPGGDDEEFLTLELAPGNYGLVCFLPDADGTPHAFKGMAVPFTVS